MTSQVERQARQNRAAAELADFTVLLAAALEDPAIQKQITAIVRRHETRAKRASTPTARDIKISRLGGKGNRG